MIVVYSQDNCPGCEKAKAFLTLKKIPFIVRNISTEPAAKQFILQEGHRSVPVVYDDHIHIKDYTSLVPQN